MLWGYLVHKVKTKGLGLGSYDLNPIWFHFAGITSQI
jgi:hypothetical protein